MLSQSAQAGMRNGKQQPAQSATQEQEAALLHVFAASVANLLDIEYDKSPQAIKMLFHHVNDAFQKLEAQIDALTAKQLTIKMDIGVQTIGLEGSQVFSAQLPSQQVEVFSLECSKAGLPATLQTLGTQTFKISPSDLAFSDYSDLAQNADLLQQGAKMTAIQNQNIRALNGSYFRLNASEIRHSAVVSRRETARRIRVLRDFREMAVDSAQLVELLRYYVLTGREIADHGALPDARTRVALVLRFLPECSFQAVGQHSAAVKTTQELSQLADALPTPFQGFRAIYDGKELTYRLENGHSTAQADAARENLVLIL